MNRYQRRSALLTIIFLLLCGMVFILSYSGFVRIMGHEYYWNHTHFIREQWIKVRRVDCYFGEDGRLYTGWLTQGNERKYLISGIPVTGEFVIKDSEYYFDPDGVMVTGIADTGSGTHYYAENGARKTGWVTLGDDSYYFTDTDMTRGWYDEDNSRYYFSQDGKMVTGWIRIDGNFYYFTDKGKMMRNGWFADGNTDYYLFADGHAACGQTKLDGRIYCFSDTGRLLKNTWTGNSYAGEDGTLQTSCTIDGLRVDKKGRKIYDGDYGDGGSLYIPTLGVKVPAWKTEGGSEGQRITDAANSAALLTSFKMPVIADHKNQGFEAIKSSVPEDTIAFVLTPDSVTEYLCSSIFTGTNVENDILDSTGKSIDGLSSDLCLYTCNENWRHVTIVLFQKK